MSEAFAAQRLAWGAGLVAVAGVATGLVAAFLGDLELRWVIGALLAVVGTAIFLAVPDKQRFTYAIMVFGMQADVYVRAMYGRAGSTGLAFPLVFFVGLLLVVTMLANGRHLQPGGMIAGGALRRPIALMLATTVVACLFTSEPFSGFVRLVFELQLYFMYWLVVNNNRSEDDLKRTVTMLLVVLCMQSLVSYVEEVLGVNFSLTGDVSEGGDVTRIGGTVSSNAAGYASFIMPALLVAVAFFLCRARTFGTRMATIAALLGAASLALTYTRAAYAGFLLGLSVAGFLLFRRRLLSTPKMTGLLVLVGAIAAVVLPLLLMRVNRDYGTQSSWEERWGLMRIAFNVILHRPVFGVGPNAYWFAFKSYLPDGMSGQWLFTVHNEFLLRMAETGVVGGLAFVWLIVVAWRVATRVARAGSLYMQIVAAGWAGALVALVWQMNWVPWRGFSYNAMFWVMLAVGDAMDRICLERARSAAWSARGERGAPYPTRPDVASPGTAAR